jgi:hypothetical protein
LKGSDMPRSGPPCFERANRTALPSEGLPRVCENVHVTRDWTVATQNPGGEVPTILEF